MVKEMTETNLRSAFAGESQAHVRYRIFAERAEKSGWPNVARLFGAISIAERIHAGNHFRNILTKGGAQTVSAAVFGARNTSEDLQAGIDGETFEINEMYPVYKAVAQFQGEKAAETSFTWALETEKVHASLYRKAKQAVDQGKDAVLGPIQICSVCGFTIEGDAPDKCPICGASRDTFKTF
ncbi:MAG TPA: rubrerythrin family protein [candidate division Zixibacteria bacterium]|nr:rubrerythrin family protein [candidate division Zixibacteria bacterium]